MMILKITLILQFVSVLESINTEENETSTPEQVVVRAVFINCEPNEEQSFLENEATRFQRDELFKHAALQSCRKKLALTVKISSDPDKTSGDEYIPIEHVFDGSNKRRARLLDPYILRLRREAPLQAYKLRRIDTVTGILSKFENRRSSNFKKNRVQRYSADLSNREDKKLPSKTIGESENPQGINQCVLDLNETSNLTRSSISLKPKPNTLEVSPLGSDEELLSDEILAKHKTNRQDDDGRLEYEYLKENTRDKRDTCTFPNNPAWKRDKRHEHNIIVEDISDDYKIPWTSKDRFYRRLERPTEAQEDNASLNRDSGEIAAANDKSANPVEKTLRRDTTDKKHSKDKQENTTNSMDTLDERSTRRSSDKKTKNINSQNNEYETAEKSFVLYDIGNPDLWYTVHVQLFEKMSTPEGKTVWNDITKGEIARVSTIQPEWSDQDINVRYKPAEWLSKDEFELPSTTSLCLLAPLHDERSISLDDDGVGLGNVGKYLVVPKEDIVGLDDTSILNKRGDNYSETTNSITRDEQGHRRVLVRVSRALLTDNEEDLKISSLGPDRFLILPHRRPHQAQIDLEARADENQLIRVGSSGSLITIVADNSRKKRSVITVQATNKGLAAARFRVRARDCGPKMASAINEKSEGITAGPILVPPRHTQRFKLELPTEIPVSTIHCSVALINDDEESVAVRDVAIKKGDRCFCVWHCDCVCLNEDPKLTCREMAEARQAAAGLSPRERARRSRSVAYSDCVTVNLFVMVVGVLMALFTLGLAKAVFGLFCRCVGMWGLHKLIQAPRKLERYYESSLQGRAVVYDKEGWPVHPDTKQRTVRIISMSMQFILNLILFIVLPCMMFRDAVVQLSSGSNVRRIDPSLGKDDKNCFSTHDMQMRPLLIERRRPEDLQSSCVDSEQDDTEYVLMQMQKSKESLARSQKKVNESETTSSKKQISPESKVSHNFRH